MNEQGNAGVRNPVPTLLLDHRGRKSGKTFTTPLLYVAEGKDLVVVDSQGAKTRLVDAYADFDTYQPWTDREIPVVILHPRQRV